MIATVLAGILWILQCEHQWQTYFISFLNGCISFLGGIFALTAVITFGVTLDDAFRNDGLFFCGMVNPNQTSVGPCFHFDGSEILNQPPLHKR